MQIIPAIDLKNNQCVRLSRGKDNSSKIFNSDPQSQATYFEKIGCKKIHIVDLDAAFGRPDVNINSIKKIRKSVSIPIQLGGGIRSITSAEKYFDLGIDNLIIGSMAINKIDSVKSISNKNKNKIYISLDIKDNNVMIKGWTQKSTLNVEGLLTQYKNSNIKGYIITDIKNDGMLNGLDTIFLKNISRLVNKINNNEKKFIFAGGLTNYEDLKNLNKLNLKNLEGIVSGKSFYVGNIDLKKAQTILDNNG